MNQVEQPEEPQELTFDYIYNELVSHDEIILDNLDSTEVARVRKGLSDYKSKLNKRLKKQDLPTEDRNIEFEVLEVYKNMSVKMRVFFTQKKGVKVKLIPSDGSLA